MAYLPCTFSVRCRQHVTCCRQHVTFSASKAYLPCSFSARHLPNVTFLPRPLRTKTLYTQSTANLVILILYLWAEGRVGYGTQTGYIFPYSTSARVITNLSSSFKYIKAQSFKFQNVILRRSAQSLECNFCTVCIRSVTHWHSQYALCNKNRGSSIYVFIPLVVRASDWWISAYWKLSHKREWNTEKYSASASYIQWGQRPIWIWDADALYFPYFHERACDNVFIFKQTWRVT